MVGISYLSGRVGEGALGVEEVGSGSCRRQNVSGVGVGDEPGQVERIGSCIGGVVGADVTAQLEEGVGGADAGRRAGFGVVDDLPQGVDGLARSGQDADGIIQVGRPADRAELPEAASVPLPTIPPGANRPVGKVWVLLL